MKPVEALIKILRNINANSYKNEELEAIKTIVIDYVKKQLDTYQIDIINKLIAKNEKVSFELANAVIEIAKKDENIDWLFSMYHLHLYDSDNFYYEDITDLIADSLYEFYIFFANILNGIETIFDKKQEE